MEGFFYLFGSLAVVSGWMVIRAPNPVYSILSLVLVFVNAAGLLILYGLDFFALMFLVVYVGAIAVLFLFVVMMLNIKIEERQETLYRYVPTGAFIGLLFLVEVLIAVDSDLLLPFTQRDQAIGPLTQLLSPSMPGWHLKESINIVALGDVLFTYYFYQFLMAGMILLVAMIGAIVLTLHRDERVKRQEVFEQNLRDFSQTVKKVRGSDAITRT